MPVDGEEPESSGPTIVVDCTPLPLSSRASDFRDGIDLMVPSVRRTPPESMSPRAKMCNYINVILGDLEVKTRNPRAWAVLLDTYGNLAEGMGSNFFLVHKGALLTPRADFVLPGISRDVVMQLAAELDIECHESDLSLYDACNADEAFLTSTSLCLCPVRSINGTALKDAAIPGPVTKRLTVAYRDLVDFDFVAQYLRYLRD
jgi:branched-chain amino acid aminotransferase